MTTATDDEMAAEKAPTPHEDAVFPLRVACIDMGSNAIRFVASEFATETDSVRLASDRSPIRLGHGVYLSGRLGTAAMDAAVEALDSYREQMEALGVGSSRAVATSAVRESTNGDEFVERVQRETGIELDVISGSEEARLVHLAVSRKVPLGTRQWLLVDLGGGSVEVSLVDANGTFWSESHTMGSVRLLEELTGAGDDPGRFRRLLEEYISVLHVPPAAQHRKVAGYIATGGNIETLAKLGGFPDEDGVTTLPVETLRAVIEQLARMSFRQRVDELGLREDRADVVLPAALVYERLAELCGANEIIVPHVGIKEGVLYDLVSRLTSHRDHEDRQERDVLIGAVTLGRKYLFDEDHSRHVARLAVSIFDQTRPLHELGGADRKILTAAALLHDIGQFVSYKGHHKHSLYLISNSELPTFTQREMQLVANVARYHRKGEPAPHHPHFEALSDVDKDRVVKLSALLRLADSLDREHVQRVQHVEARIGDSEVTLWLEGSGELLLEGWSLKKKAQLFTKVFGRKVRLRFVDGGSDEEQLAAAGGD
jgi:exopolyphosphatase/guanosine-5'-triphosphate,3'-diphosphate pyrophosphatase